MFWLTFLAALLLDQTTKLLAANYGEVVFNQGMALSWGEQLPAGLITLVLIILAVVLGAWFYREWRRYPVIAGLFWAGVISNLLDRVMFGRVSDWLPLPGVNLKNNLADIYLSLALFSLLIMELKRKYADRDESYL